MSKQTTLSLFLPLLLLGCSKKEEISSPAEVSHENQEEMIFFSPEESEALAQFPSASGSLGPNPPGTSVAYCWCCNYGVLQMVVVIGDLNPDCDIACASPNVGGEPVDGPGDCLPPREKDPREGPSNPWGENTGGGGTGGLGGPKGSGPKIVAGGANHNPNSHVDLYVNGIPSAQNQIFTNGLTSSIKRLRFGLNNDDDNQNGIKDLEEQGPVANENDFLDITLVGSECQSPQDFNGGILGSDLWHWEYLGWRLRYPQQLIRIYTPNGQFLPTGSQIPFGNGPHSFLVEGIQIGKSGWNGIQEIKLERLTKLTTIAASVVKEYNHGWVDQMSIGFSVMGIDLDIDSDNTNGEELPDRSEAEDAIEDIAGDPMKPGKFVYVNRDDDEVADLDDDQKDDEEADGIEDLIDGYNFDGIAGNADDLNDRENDFVPVVIELQTKNFTGSDRAGIRLKFTYNASDPVTDVDPLLGAQHQLRLWTKPGNVARDPRSVSASPAGDFVPPGEYSYHPFNWNTEKGTITLYLEATKESSFPNNVPAGEQIKIELDPGFEDNPIGFLAQDAVRVTPVRMDFYSEVLAVHPLGSLNALYNPALIVKDNTPAIFQLFEIQPITPAPNVFAGVDNARLKWKLSPDSIGTVDFVDDMGTQFSVKGTGLGKVEFRLEIDGAEMSSPRIQSEVVDEKVVALRVNIIKTSSLATYYDTAEEIHQAIDYMNIFWRQAGIRVVLESSTELTDISPGTVANSLENGIFQLEIPSQFFDGTLYESDSMNEEIESYYLTNSNRSPSTDVVNVYSIHDVIFPAGPGGLASPGNASNPVTEPVHLVVAALDIQNVFQGISAMTIDGDFAEGSGQELGWSSWAHELGHVLKLSHPNHTGTMSPLIKYGVINLMNPDNGYDTAGELIYRQAEIARQSTFCQD